MSGHRVLHDILAAPFLVNDPGNGGIIPIDRWGLVCPVVTAGAETRVLPEPSKAGLVAIVDFDTDGGDLTLTVTGGYNAAGATAIVFDDAGDWVALMSIKVGADYRWRVLRSEGVGLGEAVGSLVVAGAANVGSLIQAQGAPTAVADGDTAITAANLATKILTMAATQARAPTLPTGTAMNGALAVGESVDWSFINLAAGAHTITVTGATGHTIVGKATLAQNEQGLFRTRVSAANTAITYRLA